MEKQLVSVFAITASVLKTTDCDTFAFFCHGPFSERGAALT